LTLLSGQRPFPAIHRGTAGPWSYKIISRAFLRPGPRRADRPAAARRLAIGISVDL